MEHAMTGQDLFFSCGRCEASLVVDGAAAGMMLSCEECGQPIIVPTLTKSPVPNPEREAALQRSLKENESQRTEISGYINQLNIQLHRWQLRQQTLDARNGELTAELASLASVPVSAPTP